MPRRVAALAAVALGVGALWLGVLASGATYAGGPAPAPDFRVADPRISESSGLARSVRHPHVVWTANDSGDDGRIFAVDTRTGRTVGVHTFAAPVRDVEALAVTPQGRVLVGDVGDNTAARGSVTVYGFDEPDLGDTSGGWTSWDLAYPDGPHDAESLAVDPRTGRVVVVTKGRTGAAYALPAEPRTTGTNRLVRVGAGPAVATDAVYLADGSALAVRTYTGLWLLDPVTWAVRTTVLLPLQPQGETLALDPDGPGLLVGSEGRGSLVQHVAVPAEAGTPGSAATPPATAAAPPPATATAPTSRTRDAAPGATPRPGPDGRDGSPWGPAVAVLAGVAVLLAAARLAVRRRRR
ncbi:hypothetical protein GCM10027517_25560 [Phycicoccus ginsengisoli]